MASKQRILDSQLEDRARGLTEEQIQLLRCHFCACEFPWSKICEVHVGTTGYNDIVPGASSCLIIHTNALDEQHTLLSMALIMSHDLVNACARTVVHPCPAGRPTCRHQ